jgi:hypothetical protein
MFDPKTLEMNSNVRMGIFAKPVISMKNDCRKNMDQILYDLDANQKELIGQLKVSGEAAYYKLLWFIVVLVAGLSIFVCLVDECDDNMKSTPLILTVIAAVFIIILVLIRISNATYKNDLAQAIL